MIAWLRQRWTSSPLGACSRVGDSPHLHGRPFIDNQGTLEIGDRFRLLSSPVRSHLVVGPGATLRIGNNVTIEHGAAISANLSIEIGDDVHLGPFAMLLDSDFHDPSNREASGRRSPIVIEQGARLGSRVTVLRGAHIGRNAQVAAASSVSDSVPAGASVSGVPARPTGSPARSDDPSMPLNPSAAIPALIRDLLNLDRPLRLDDGPAQIAQWDSLAMLKILVALEEHFQVTLDERDLSGRTTVGGLLAVVEQALASR